MHIYSSGMKKTITVLALMLACLAAGAQQYEGSFTQAKTLKVSGKVIKSAGTLSFKAPDQMVMLYTQPDGDYFIIDGPFLRMDMRGTALDVDTSTNKAIKIQRNALLYSISGDYDKIAAEMDADINVSPKAGGKHVVIKVRNPQPRSYSAMELDYGKDGRLIRMVLEEGSSISTEYILNLK